MQMSSACFPPINAPFKATDAAHPKYPEYLNYRAAMGRQLVACPSFDNWLAMLDRDTESRNMNMHPRIGAYRKWLKENVNCEPPKAVYLGFYMWLEAY